MSSSVSAGSVSNSRSSDQAGLTYSAAVPVSTSAQSVPDLISSSVGTTRGRDYTLSLVSVPVQCTTSGSGLCDPPLIAELTIHDATGVDLEVVHDDLPYLVASVSLWNNDGSVRIPSGTIRGDLVASAQTFQGADYIERVYFIFPGLQITSAGSYRFGVTLTGLWPDKTSLPATHPSAGVVVTGVVADTITIAVPESSPLAVGSVQIDARTAGLLQALTDQGARLTGSERSSSSSH